MNLKEIRDKFLKIEEDLDLFNKKIQDIYFWEYIRFSLFNKIISKKKIYRVSYIKKKKNLLSRIKTKIEIIINSFTNNPIWRATQKDIIIYGHRRRKKLENGKFWDIYIDFFIDSLPYSYQAIEDQYSGTHLKPPRNKEIKYTDWFLLLDFFHKKSFSLKSLNKEEIKIINRITNKIESDFKLKINILDIVKNMFINREIIKRRLNKILDKYKPRLVIEVVSYRLQNKVLNEVCKNLNIPTIELQHGSVNEYHLGYYFPYYPREGLKTFPDYFFTFSDFWNNTIEYPIDRKNIKAVGFPFFEYQFAKYKGSYKKEQVVFISDSKIGMKLSKIALELRKLLPNNFNVVYKLHPEEYDIWRRTYTWLIGCKGIEVIDQHQDNLYKLFAESKYQVGVNSTAIYEGIGFGLKTFLIRLPGIEHMEYLINNSLAVEVRDAMELEKGIRNKNTSSIVIDLFFKNNSITNIIDSIKDIVNKPC